MTASRNTAALQTGRFNYTLMCGLTFRLLRQRNPKLYIYIYIYWCDPVQPTRNGPTSAHARGRAVRATIFTTHADQKWTNKCAREGGRAVRATNRSDMYMYMCIYIYQPHIYIYIRYTIYINIYIYILQGWGGLATSKTHRLFKPADLSTTVCVKLRCGCSGSGIIPNWNGQPTDLICICTCFIYIYIPMFYYIYI